MSQPQFQLFGQWSFVLPISYHVVECEQLTLGDIEDLYLADAGADGDATCVRRKCNRPHFGLIEFHLGGRQYDYFRVG